jgi:hypothetical protein
LILVCPYFGEQIMTQTLRRKFDFNIQPVYPSVDDLIQKAQRVTDSCFLKEQVFVSSAFFKSVVNRGLTVRQYNEEEAKRLFHVVDHMAHTKLARLFKADFADNL